MKNIKVKVKEFILKPINKVFDAIINPDKLSGFSTSRASQPIRKGQNIMLYLNGVIGESSVQVKEVIPNTLISFNWTANGIDAAVKIILESTNSTKNLNIDNRRKLSVKQGWC